MSVSQSMKHYFVQMGWRQTIGHSNQNNIEPCKEHERSTTVRSEWDPCKGHVLHITLSTKAWFCIINMHTPNMGLVLRRICNLVQ